MVWWGALTSTSGSREGLLCVVGADGAAGGVWFCDSADCASKAPGKASKARVFCVLKQSEFIPRFKKIQFPAVSLAGGKTVNLAPHPKRTRGF